MAIIKIRDNNGNIIEVPALKGEAGKSAYEYAKDGGYTGTAEEFASKLAFLMGYSVWGYVDEDNNIIITANLPDGTYSIKYEMEGNKTVNIGELVLDSNVYYSITKNLTNCTISNSATSVVKGEGYSATITVNDGYEISSVVVTMGGANVSVTNGVISIANVTGDIVITAVAEESVSAYTNLLPLSVDANGNEFVGTNGEDGYKTGYRLNSSGAETAATGVECTGFMPYTDANDKIYIKSIELASSETHNNMIFYDSSKAVIKNLYISTASDAFVLNGDIWTVSPNKQTILTGVAFFRFSAGSITDQTIVTVNEEIV